MDLWDNNSGCTWLCTRGVVPSTWLLSLCSSFRTSLHAKYFCTIAPLAIQIKFSIAEIKFWKPKIDWSDLLLFIANRPSGKIIRACRLIRRLFRTQILSVFVRVLSYRVPNLSLAKKNLTPFYDSVGFSEWITFVEHFLLTNYFVNKFSWFSIFWNKHFHSFSSVLQRFMYVKTEINSSLFILIALFSTVLIKFFIGMKKVFCIPKYSFNIKQ